MELKKGTRVYSADGKEIGDINRFVMNPVSKKVTHIVVQKGLFFPEDKVVPAGWITSAQPDRVTLSARSDAVKDLPPFEETHYVGLDESERRRFAMAPYVWSPTYYWYPPYGAPAFAYPYYPFNVATETEQNIPENTVALKEGANVISADGEHIGDVERVFTDPETSRATHFLISQGLFLKERKLIPTHWISTIKEEKVLLAVGSQFMDQLPAYQIESK